MQTAAGISERIAWSATAIAIGTARTLLGPDRGVTFVAAGLSTAGL